MEHRKLTQRNKEICRIFRSNLNVQATAAEFNITRERVRQILALSGIYLKTFKQNQNLEMAIELSLQKAKDLNKMPFHSDLLKICKGHSGNIKLCRNYLLRQGFKKIYEKRYTKEELISRMQQLAEKLGKTPTALDIMVNKLPNVQTYMNYFGSLNNARKAAGLIPPKKGGYRGIGKPRYSKAFLISHYEQLAKKLGRMPITKEINLHGPPSLTVYRKYFGSIKNIRQAAGLPPVKIKGGGRPKKKETKQ